MSAPSKLAAIRHAVSALHGAADDGADTRRYADALQETGVAIDALIEAADDALQATPGAHQINANTRLMAALARVKRGAA